MTDLIRATQDVAELRADLNAGKFVNRSRVASVIYVANATGNSTLISTLADILRAHGYVVPDGSIDPDWEIVGEI